MLTLLGYPGTGSALAEAFLTLANISYERHDVDYSVESKEKHYLKSLNPLVQVPTLVFPDQSVLTESLAIALYAQSKHPELELILHEDMNFWRWILIINTSIYPTFCYGDSPEKWCTPLEGRKQLRMTTDQYRNELWSQLEMQCGHPYFLGEKSCAIDYYIYVMSHWRPRQEWFLQNCPKLSRVIQLLDAHPQLQDIWDENFGEERLIELEDEEEEVDL
ncbi:MAG: glutathione S-transferase family protein [Bdellovibrionales bacterium]|nr:glutathione S-transferase family protein [Bdellovibrionales bacterium]